MMLTWLAGKWLDAVDRARAIKAESERMRQLHADPNAQCQECDGSGMVAVWQRGRYCGDEMCCYCGGVGIKPELIVRDFK